MSPINPVLSRRALLAAAALLPLAGQASPAAAAGARGGAQDHYARAARLAGDDPVLLALVGALRPDAEFPSVDAPAPLRIFDDLAVVSTGFVSATALLTSDGVILIDALGSAQDAEEVIEPRLRAVDVDPSAIRYVVVTHGHADHYGGARYLAERYGARVMMGAADWDLVETGPSPGAPARDLEVSDGQRLTLGRTTLSFHSTPGHTPGTVSMILPVRWRGRPHTAMLWGGTNPPSVTADKQVYLSSALRFATRMRQAGVDVELNNHQGCDYGLARMEQLPSRPTGQDNPFIIGRTRSLRFMEVMATMLRGRIATDRETGGTVRTSAIAHCCSPL